MLPHLNERFWTTYFYCSFDFVSVGTITGVFYSLFFNLLVIVYVLKSV